MTRMCYLALGLAALFLLATSASGQLDHVQGGCNVSNQSFAGKLEDPSPPDQSLHQSSLLPEGASLLMGSSDTGLAEGLLVPDPSFSDIGSTTTWYQCLSNDSLCGGCPSGTHCAWEICFTPQGSCGLNGNLGCVGDCVFSNCKQFCL